MSQAPTLVHPWLVAVWPGMGQVAVSAGYYLMSKLGMHGLAEFSPRELFDVEHVEVKAGLIKSGRLPRSRLFAWNDPRQEHDLLVFIGEAQPPVGRYPFCHKLIEYTKDLGVERVFTFAAMATDMHPEHASRVFAAATNEAVLAELRQQEVEVLAQPVIAAERLQSRFPVRDRADQVAALLESRQDRRALRVLLKNVGAQPRFPDRQPARLEALLDAKATEDLADHRVAPRPLALPVDGQIGRRAGRDGADNLARAKSLAGWEASLRTHWGNVRIEQASVTRSRGKTSWRARVHLGPLLPGDVEAQLYAAPRNGDTPEIIPMKPRAAEDRACWYEAQVPAGRSPSEFTVRVVPTHPDAQQPLDMPLVTWKE